MADTAVKKNNTAITIMEAKAKAAQAIARADKLYIRHVDGVTAGSVPNSHKKRKASLGTLTTTEFPSPLPLPVPRRVPA